MKSRAAGSAIVLLSGLLIATPAFAATITALSSSRGDVQAAIDAAATGDIVVVPAGNSQWSTAVTIPNSKKIALLGAGMENTVVTMNPAGFVVRLNQSGSRLAGFRFNNATVSVDGDGWRVDHCMITGDGANIDGVWASGNRENHHPTGVVDHCVFLNKRVLVNGWAGLMAHALWAQPVVFGAGEGFVYIEDCVFSSDDRLGYAQSLVIDGNYGSSFVFRYNVVNDGYLHNHGIRATARAVRVIEIYGNVINQVSKTMWAPMFFRSGTGVIYDNEVTGTWSVVGIALDNPRSCEALGDGGLADGTSPWDGNTLPTEVYQGYPARDQIGRGRDEWLWTDENPYPPQSLEPMYGWNNRHGANDVLFFQHGCERSVLHVQPGRDYYDKVPKPGYSPYTYPHPLIEEWEEQCGGDAFLPAAPSGLRIRN